MSNGRYSAGSVALAFLMGGAVGAGLALLITPRSGPETRKILKGQASAAREEALKVADKVADEVREKTVELIEKSKEVVEAKKAVLESALEAGKEAMEREKERLMAKIGKEDKENEEADAL